MCQNLIDKMAEVARLVGMELRKYVKDGQGRQYRGLHLVHLENEDDGELLGSRVQELSCPMSDSEEDESAQEPEAPEEGPADPEPETPPAEETEDGSESMKDLIDAIGNLNETITGAVTQEPEELPAEGEEGGGGSGGNLVVEESAGVDLTPVVQVLAHTNELLVKQEEILVTQHNDLLQLQANVDFVFLAVATLIGVVLGVSVGKLFHDLWRA